MRYRHIIGTVCFLIIWLVLLQQAMTRPVNGERIQIESASRITVSGTGLEVGPAIAYATQYTGVVISLAGALLLVSQTIKKVEFKDSSVLLALIGVVLFTQHWAAIIGVVLLMLARIVVARWPVPPALT